MTRMIITIPKNVKRAIEMASAVRGCSESEVVRTALYYHLKEYIELEVE
jgi:metal-responsive CopG/Arc/MetJ family transcriptional regulator